MIAIVVTTPHHLFEAAIQREVTQIKVVIRIEILMGSLSPTLITRYSLV